MHLIPLMSKYGNISFQFPLLHPLLLHRIQPLHWKGIFNKKSKLSEIYTHIFKKSLIIVERFPVYYYSIAHAQNTHCKRLCSSSMNLKKRRVFVEKSLLKCRRYALCMNDTRVRRACEMQDNADTLEIFSNNKPSFMFY